MNKFLKFSFVALLFAGFAIALNSCKKDFDSPPGPSDPAIVANTTIKQLKALHTIGGAYDVITNDLIIEGVVIANDRSGNLYKQIYIQDTTGSLQVALDAVSLFNTYPVGRKVFIRCKDLCISDYNGTGQLGVKATVAGLPSFEGIPGALISKYVVGGSLNNPISIKQVTMADLNAAGANANLPVQPNSNPVRYQTWQNKYVGDLIELDGYGFVNLNDYYSDTSVYKATTNRDIKDCSNPANTIIVRTSAYANFAGFKVAQGRGKITSIYTIFNTTKQLIIRDTNDVKFTNPYSCNLTPGTIFLEDFETLTTNNATLNLPNWKNIGETGGISYQAALFGPVKCAKISAFSTGAASVTSWLITPPISLAGATAPKLSFTNAAGHLLGSVSFKTYISTNYNGSNNPSASTWTELPATYVTPITGGFTSFVGSGNINLSAYIGQNVYIAWKYVGGDPTATTTWEIDDVKVTAQ